MNPRRFFTRFPFIVRTGTQSVVFSRNRLTRLKNDDIIYDCISIASSGRNVCLIMERTHTGQGDTGSNEGVMF